MEGNSKAPLSCAELQAGMQAAFDCITPVWPLDRYIAVNPWWNLTQSAMPDCAAKLAFWHGAQALMPRSYYQEQWQRGRIEARHLERSAQELGVYASVGELLKHLDHTRELSSLRLITDELDLMRDTERSVSWHDEVINRISRYCAGFFDRHQAQWSGGSQSEFYEDWRQTAMQDRGVEMLMNGKGLRALFAGLPQDHEVLIREAVEALPLSAEAWSHYACGLLLSVGGWASYCAYLEWEANTDVVETVNPLRQLLAIRLAWDWVLWQYADPPELEQRLRRNARCWPQSVEAHRHRLEWDWVWQRAFEVAYQDRFIHTLESAVAPESAPELKADAVFCIDVRSEPLRRELEAVSGQQVRTRGFAGFFGMPIAYQALGSERAIPHLPGLLAPAYVVREQEGEGSCARSRQRTGWTEQLWSRFSQSGIGIFGFVESLGMHYGVKLVKDGLLGKVESSGDSVNGVGPTLYGPQGEASVEQRIDLAHAALKGMALTRDFAPWVLLIGHGSSTQNNPHAASLDCGACCGQRGEVNSRLLASLLNDPAVRTGLLAKGVEIPTTTQFVAALHVTTLDRVRLFTEDLATDVDASGTGELKRWFAQAGARVRRERAGRLGLEADSEEALAQRMERYALDWSQVRPEWGLAGNAAFVIAPRARTLGLNLEGRSFLHEYHAGEDVDGSILEQIMTAPMVVTHWINLQYYASTVDPFHYGAGNKVIHNVVGGSMGVLEGNGGDLRTGLPWQSVHDGTSWVHEPMRLNVVIEAPAAAIERVMQAHAKVRDLIDGQWLYLFRIDAAHGCVERYHNGQWIAHRDTAVAQT